jgi:hypothetical protein
MVAQTPQHQRTTCCVVCQPESQCASMIGGFQVIIFLFYAFGFTTIVLLNCSIYFVIDYMMSLIYYLCAGW